MHAVVAEGYLLHPLNGLGYQFFSGIGSSISEWLTVLIAIGVFLYHKNCHVHGCWRLSWHPSAMHGDHPVCKRHHSHHPKGGGHTHVITSEGKTGARRAPV